jgi:hypothetical protein
MVGRNRYFKEVYFEVDESVNAGDLIRIKILASEGWILKGERAWN